MKKCIFCGKNKKVKLFCQEKWCLYKCLGCGLVSTKRSEEPDYRKYHRDEEYNKSEKQFKNIFEKRYQIINKFFKKGKILEIGCSEGLLLDCFDGRKWERWGVEPSLSAKNAAERKIKVLNKFFEKAVLPNNYFNVVVMNHTLEHIDNPVKVIELIYKHLKKGGIIFIDVPNFGSISSKILRKRWRLLAPDEHNHHFTKETLQKILEKSGFKVIYTETRSGIFDYQHPFLELWYALIGFKKRFISDVFSIPLALIEKLFNQGTALTMVARK